MRVLFNKHSPRTATTFFPSHLQIERLMIPFKWPGLALVECLDAVEHTYKDLLPKNVYI